MATRNLSPGGALLRASRLFSIPNPLPKPTSEINSTVYFNSDTATLPYPTHLTITTPPSSLSRGDWGLKRPLPLAAAKSSTPLIRVNSIDTFEHITEYQSAADHALTLQKWQEMNIPVSMPSTPEAATRKSQSRKISGGSVFEEDLSPGSAGRTSATQHDKRWRFDGPFLAGLTVGEFNQYVRKNIRERKDEFYVFLKEKKAGQISETARKAALENGHDIPPPLGANDISDEQLQLFIRSLRQDPRALFKIIGSFLDLPPAPSPPGFIQESIAHFLQSMKADSKKDTPTIRLEDFLPTSRSPYSETGPPKTHPSAGLSYLRANSYVYNHPVYGPQNRPPPIEGRVILPKMPEKRNYVAKIGIAGVVTDAPVADGTSASSTPKAKYMPEQKPMYPGLNKLEPGKVGGSKLWFHPESAFIDSDGQIDLTLASSDGAAFAIHQGKEYETSNLGRKPMNQPQPKPKPEERLRYGLESQYASGVRQQKTNPSDSGDGSDAIMQLRHIFESDDKKH